MVAGSPRKTPKVVAGRLCKLSICAKNVETGSPRPAMALTKVSTDGPRFPLASIFEMAFCRSPPAMATSVCDRRPRARTNAARISFQSIQPTL